MKRRVILMTAVTAIVLILLLAGCSSGPNPTPSPTPEPQSSVTVAIEASPGHLGASETYQFTAVVSNAFNTAVIWSLSGCTSGCGTISDSGVYAAPAFVENTGTVTINATARVDKTKSASANIRLMPVSLLLTPSTLATVVPGGTRTLTAWLDHDPNNAGVTWTLSGGDCSGANCGALSDVTAASVLYHAPETAPTTETVTIAATSVTDGSCSKIVTISVTATPLALTGKYAFLINGWRRMVDYSQFPEAIAGQFDADGKGHLTGIVDANLGSTVEAGQEMTGTYDIRPDGIGTITLTFAGLDWTYIISVDSSGESGKLAESSAGYGGPLTELRGSSGYVTRQNTGSFNLSSVQGDRVIAMYGEVTGSHVAALGRFTSNAEGKLSNGVADLSWELHENIAKFPNSVTLTGAFAAPDPANGRGTAALNVGAGVTYNFAYYIVSLDRMLLVQADVSGYTSGIMLPQLTGEGRHQVNAGNFTSTSMNDVTVFHMTDSTSDGFACGLYPDIRIGKMVANGSGALSMTYDQNSNGEVISNATRTGSYSVSANGRVTWDVPELAIAYLLDDNKGYFAKANGCGAGFGAFEMQTGGPFSVQSHAGTYRVNTGPAATVEAQNDAGWMTLANDGTVTGTLYVNSGSGASPYKFTGTATVSSDGRGTLFVNATPPSTARQVVFWTISPTRDVAILTVNPGDTLPALLDLRRTE